MSRTTVFAIEPDGATIPWCYLHNSARYALMAWMAIANRYTPGQIPMFDPDGWWAKADEAMRKAQAPACDLITFEASFDRWAIRGPILSTVATAFREFDNRHWPPGHPRYGISHYPEIANSLDTLADKGAEGACIWTTSTTPDPWGGYNFNTGTDHKWVCEDTGSFGA